MTSKRLATTAYHEAGHVIADIFAADQPIRFRQVTIVSGEDSWGHVEHRRTPLWLIREWETCPSPRAERAAWNRAVAALAGKAAADKYHGKRANRGSAVYIEHPVHGKVLAGGCDASNVTDYLLVISGGDPGEIPLLSRLAAYRARRLVEAHWEYVERLAEALLERCALTEDEVRDVLFRPRVSRATVT